MANIDKFISELSDNQKRLVKEGIVRQNKILASDLVDDRWYVSMVNSALEQAEATARIAGNINVYRDQMELLNRMVSESNRSLSDETSAGSYDFFNNRLFYYAFDYLPFPYEIETSCHIDTVANKMVASGTEKEIDFKLEDAYYEGSSAELNVKGNTIDVNDIVSPSNIYFTLLPQKTFNLTQFQAVSEGLSGSIVSVKDEDGVELLEHSVPLSTMRMIRLYLSKTDQRLSVKLSVTPSGENARLTIRKVKMFNRKYNNSDTLELYLKASGDMSVKMGYFGEGSVSVSAITDGTYDNSYSVYNESPINVSCEDSVRLMFNINTDGENTPVFKYLSVTSQAVISNVL